MTFLTSDATKHTKWWKNCVLMILESKNHCRSRPLIFLIVIRFLHKLLQFIFCWICSILHWEIERKNTWRVWLVVTVRFYFSIFQNFWFLFKFDCRKSKMCKFTTKARLHFFSSYNQIIPPDEMKTERKNSIKKKGERQKKRILNRREKLPTDTKMKGN